MFHLHRQVGMKYLPAYEDGTECSETSAYKIQTSGNYREESTHQLVTRLHIASRLRMTGSILLLPLCLLGVLRDNSLMRFEGGPG